MHISSCPCCKGAAKFFVVIIAEVKQWQIGCLSCGLTTIYGDNKYDLLQKWNKRQELANCKKWIWFVFLLMLIVGIVLFFSGYFLALKSLIHL